MFDKSYQEHMHSVFPTSHAHAPLILCHVPIDAIPLDTFNATQSVPRSHPNSEYTLPRIFQLRKEVLILSICAYTCSRLFQT